MDQQYLTQLFKQLETMPMYEIMRMDEQDAGYTVVLPGDQPWFVADDWQGSDVVSMNGNEVRIVAILAKHPGTGAFRRMVDGIVSAGLVPTVIEPFEQMQSILRRWGWRGRVQGKGINRCAIWRPR